MSQNSYQELVLVNTLPILSLSWPFSFQNGAIVCDINDVDVTSTPVAIALPNAALANPGTEIVFNNLGLSMGSFNILAYDQTTVITTVTAGQVINLYLYDNTTFNGRWRVIPYGGGSSSITAFTAESTDSSINISGGSVTSSGSVINFKLPTSLTNLNGVATTGFPVITADGPQTWSTVSLTAGTNITLTNGSGVNGNPVINVNPTMTSLTSVAVGNFSLTGSSCSAVGSNTGLTFSSNGTGTLTFNGAVIDGSGNVTTNNLTVGGTFVNALVPKAWCLFTDSSGTIVIHNQANVSTVTKSSTGIYTINFSSALTNDTYGVLVTIGSALSAGIPSVAQGFSIWASQSTTSCQIAVVDASGQLVTEALNGITVQILSAS